MHGTRIFRQLEVDEWFVDEGALRLAGLNPGGERCGSHNSY
jgi:hypothetical protein